MVDPVNFIKESDESNNRVQAKVNFTNDTVGPSGSIVINNGGASTSKTTVYLTLAASDPRPGCGLQSMRFLNRDSDGQLLGPSAWEPYRTGPRAWFISNLKGTKTVYVQYMDAAGNVGPRASDTIVFR